MVSKELRQEKQVGGPVNCSESELCTFLQALGEGYLPTYYSDTSQSVQSKSISIASRSYQSDKKTVAFHGFPSLQMSRNSTAHAGADTSMSSAVDSPARTSASPEEAQELVAKKADSGKRWRESFARFDRNTSLWRTHQLSLAGDWELFSATWPRWGSMRDGECWERTMQVRHIEESAFGFWLPTLTANDAKNTGSPSRHKRKTLPLDAVVGGPLNPEWCEWLMGWPLGWTELKPWGMDRFQQFRQWHGGF